MVWYGRKRKIVRATAWPNIGRFLSGPNFAIRECENRIETVHYQPISIDLTGRRKNPKLGPETCCS
jgi:hypothetical protein